MLTPEDIEGRNFLVSLRGFDRAEVRAFLAEVAEHVRDLEHRAQAAAALADEVARAPAPVEHDTEPAPEATGSAFADIGRETQRILEAAQEAAEGIGRQARVDADRQLQSARRQAARLIAEGEQRRDDIEEIVAGLEAARQSLSAQLQEIGTTIERVLGELAVPPPAATTVREALSAELAATAEAADTQPAERDAADDVYGDLPVGAEAVDAGHGGERFDEDAGHGGERFDEDAGHGGERFVEDAGHGGERFVEAADDGGERFVEAADHGGDQAGADASLRVDGGEADADDPVGAPEAGDRAGTGEGGDADLADVLTFERPEARSSDPEQLRGSLLAPLHPPLVRAIKRGLQEVQNVALDRLRRTGGEGEPESLLPADEEVQGLGAMAAEPLQTAYGAGLESAGLLAGRELPAPTAERDLVADFCADAGERVRSPLAATLRMGRSSGERPPALADRVSAVFGELKGTVAEELASTHLMRGYELALVDAWAAGGIAHRRWVLGREPRCPEARCRHNDRVGVVAIGDSYPSGHEAPPVHAGCNCTTIPVLEPPS